MSMQHTTPILIILPIGGTSLELTRKRSRGLARTSRLDGPIIVIVSIFHALGTDAVYYLPPPAHFLGGELNTLVVVTPPLLVEGGVVLLTGPVAVGLASAGDRASATLLGLLAAALSVAVDAALADLAAAETGALFALVLLLLAVGAGALELLVHELAGLVFDGLAQLDFGVGEAAAVLVEGGALEGGAGRGLLGGGAGGGFDGGGGSVGWLGFFGHGGSWDCCFAHGL